MTIMNRISDYKILKEIGSGGMGTVYCAEDFKSGENRAIKVLHSRYSRNEEFRRRFRKEAEILKKLSHDNIVKFYESGEEKGELYIVLELLEGETLDHFFKAGSEPVAADIVLKILKEAAAGLSAAHENGVVHRDIKPGNIFIKREGLSFKTKLLDMGIAKINDETTKTATGIAVGTPAYISPEVLRGEKASAASDIFSLGIIAFRLLTGKMPIILPKETSNIVAVSLAIFNSHEKGLPKVDEFLKNAEKNISKVVNKMLETDISKRYENGTELMKDLENCSIKTADPDATQFEMPLFPEEFSDHGEKKSIIKQGEDIESLKKTKEHVNEFVKYSGKFRKDNEMVVTSSGWRRIWNGTIFCHHCGTENKHIRDYCKDCGMFLYDVTFKYEDLDEFKKN